MYFETWTTENWVVAGLLLGGALIALAIAILAKGKSYNVVPPVNTTSPDSQNGLFWIALIIFAVLLIGGGFYVGTRTGVTTVTDETALKAEREAKNTAISERDEEKGLKAKALQQVKDLTKERDDEKTAKTKLQGELDEAKKVLASGTPAEKEDAAEAAIKQKAAAKMTELAQLAEKMVGFNGKVDGKTVAVTLQFPEDDKEKMEEAVATLMELLPEGVSNVRIKSVTFIATEGHSIDAKFYRYTATYSGKDVDKTMTMTGLTIDPTMTLDWASQKFAQLRARQLGEALAPYAPKVKTPAKKLIGGPLF